MNVTIEPGDPRDPQVVELLTQSHELMQSLFPEESNHYLSVDNLCGPDIRFLVARRGGETLGCGALVVKSDYGEVKSMFTDPAARGLGLGALILAGIEDQARSENLPVLRLETGHLLADAHRLYARAGFKERGPFGDYREDPKSLFMEKAL
ncbi:MAG: GNAT family N-acetyltransferase [Marinosulfonomonas sp.]|nr:GNAT family N-acetyltransferase [Marinosulfonomonas sp.]